MALAFTTTHEQQFILSHHCTVGDFPSVASVAHGQVHRVDGLEGASEMNATILVSSADSVELHCHATELHTATDVHISPCKYPHAAVTAHHSRRSQWFVDRTMNSAGMTPASQTIAVIAFSAE